eukprot:gene7205-7777_t
MIAQYSNMMDLCERIAETAERNIINIVMGSFILYLMPYIYLFDKEFDGTIRSYFRELYSAIWYFIEIWEKIILVRGFTKIVLWLNQNKVNHRKKEYPRSVVIGWNVFLKNMTNEKHTLDLPSEANLEIRDLVKDDDLLLQKLYDAIVTDPSVRYEDDEVPNFFVFLDPIKYPNNQQKPAKVDPDILLLMKRDQEDLIVRIKNLLSKVLSQSKWAEYAHHHKNYNRHIYEHPYFLISYEKEKDIKITKTTRIWLIFKEELRIVHPDRCGKFECTPLEEDNLKRNNPNLDEIGLEKAKLQIIYDKVKEHFIVKDDAWCSRIINLQKWSIIETDNSKAHYRRSYKVSLPFFKKPDQIVTLAWHIVRENQTQNQRMPRVVTRANSRRIISAASPTGNSSSSYSSSSYSLFTLVESTTPLNTIFSNQPCLIDKIFREIEGKRQNTVQSWILLDKVEDGSGIFTSKVKAFIQQSIKSSHWLQVARNNAVFSDEISFKIFYDLESNEIFIWLMYSDQLRLCSSWDENSVQTEEDQKTLKISRLSNWARMKYDPLTQPTYNDCFMIPNHP